MLKKNFGKLYNYLFYSNVYFILDLLLFFN